MSARTRRASNLSVGDHVYYYDRETRTWRETEVLMARAARGDRRFVRVQLAVCEPKYDPDTGDALLTVDTLVRRGHRFQLGEDAR